MGIIEFLTTDRPTKQVPKAVSIIAEIVLAIGAGIGIAFWLLSYKDFIFMPEYMYFVVFGAGVPAILFSFGIVIKYWIHTANVKKSRKKSEKNNMKTFAAEEAKIMQKAAPQKDEKTTTVKIQKESKTTEKPSKAEDKKATVDMKVVEEESDEIVKEAEQFVEEKETVGKTKVAEEVKTDEDVFEKQKDQLVLAKSEFEQANAELAELSNKYSKQPAKESKSKIVAETDEEKELVKKLRRQVKTNEKNIEALKEMLETATNSVEKKNLQEKIAKLEEKNNELKAKI